MCLRKTVAISRLRHERKDPINVVGVTSTTWEDETGKLTVETPNYPIKDTIVTNISVRFNYAWLGHSLLRCFDRTAEDGNKRGTFGVRGPIWDDWQRRKPVFVAHSLAPWRRLPLACSASIGVSTISRQTDYWLRASSFRERENYWVVEFAFQLRSLFCARAWNNNGLCWCFLSRIATGLELSRVCLGLSRPHNYQIATRNLAVVFARWDHDDDRPEPIVGGLRHLQPCPMPKPF